MAWTDCIPQDIADLYEVHDWHHAAAVLAHEFPEQFGELMGALGRFRISVADIVASGGNESSIPKRVSELLRPLGWREEKLNAKVIVDEGVVQSDSHWVDYVKGRVAFDLEWNSKDQTFDRDLFAALGVKNKYGASTPWMGKLLPRLRAGRGGGCPILVLGITPRLISDWGNTKVDTHVVGE